MHFSVLFCISVIIQNERRQKEREKANISLMVSMDSELGQMGPGVGCLEVERKERKCWKEKHRFSPDVNRTVLRWGERQSRTESGLGSRGGEEGNRSEGGHGAGGSDLTLFMYLFGLP